MPGPRQERKPRAPGKNASEAARHPHRPALPFRRPQRVSPLSRLDRASTLSIVFNCSGQQPLPLRLQVLEVRILRDGAIPPCPRHLALGPLRPSTRQGSQRASRFARRSAWSTAPDCTSPRIHPHRSRCPDNPASGPRPRARPRPSDSGGNWAGRRNAGRWRSAFYRTNATTSLSSFVWTLLNSA